MTGYLYTILKEAFIDFLNHSTGITQVLYRAFETLERSIYKTEIYNKVIPLRQAVIESIIETLHLVQVMDKDKYINGFKEEDFGKPLKQYCNKTIQKWKEEINKEVW
jgi:hypothetical protein